MASSTGKKSYSLNAISSLLQYGALTVFMLVSIALFIQRRSEEAYGIFALLSIIGNLSLYANLGLTQSLIRYLALQGKGKTSQTDIGVNLTLMISFAILFAVVTLIPARYVVFELMDIPFSYAHEVMPLYQALCIANILLLTGQVFNAMLDAAHKIYVASIIQFVYSLFYYGGIVTCLLLGWGMGEMGAFMLIAAGIWFALMASTALAYWGKPIFPRTNEWKGYLKKHLSYGGKIYLSSLLNFGYEPLTKILISHLFGKEMVTVYDIALKIRGQLWGIIYKVLYPLFPLFSEEKRAETTAKYLALSQRVVYLILIPVAIGVIMGTPLVISDFFHITNPVANGSVIIITLGYLFFSATVIPTALFMNAQNHPQVMIYTQLVNVVVNLGLLFLLKPIVGFYAVALASAGSIIGSWILLAIFQNKYSQFRPFANFSEWSTYIITVLILCIGGVLIAQLPISIWISAPAYTLSAILFWLVWLKQTKLLKPIINQPNLPSVVAKVAQYFK